MSWEIFLRLNSVKSRKNLLEHFLIFLWTTKFVEQFYAWNTMILEKGREKFKYTAQFSRINELYASCAVQWHKGIEDSREFF